jgi:hypothetical protein
MKFSTVVAFAGVASARGVMKREVPGEHSHEQFLRLVNQFLKEPANPLDLQDSVFGLLGNAAAAKGAGKVTNLACLQQDTADQAFTNAKASKNVTGMAAAIIYRALERNTGSVGLASELCTEKAANPEIAAITQHQDPASSVAAKNKDIEIAVAVQLASIGADPNDALKSATFPPGKVSMHSKSETSFSPSTNTQTADRRPDRQGLDL